MSVPPPQVEPAEPPREAEPTAVLWNTDGALQTILASAHEAFVSIDEQGRVLMWNACAEQTFGWPKDEAVGRRLSELIVPERHREAHQHGVRRYLETGEPTIANRRVEIEALHRDGHEVPVELTISPAVIEGRTVFNAFLHDISERREADAEAYRLASIVESSEDAIIAWTLEGMLTSWNRGAERLMGYCAGEILGKSVQSTWPPDSAILLEESKARLSAGESIPTFDSARVRKDGTLVEVSVTLSPIRDGEGRVTGVSSILRDITERKEAEDELLRYAEHLNELALLDPLTGLRNYRDFHALLDTELQRSRRYDGEWSVVLMDVDDFREINAAGGHVAGDRVLREVGVVIEEARRSSDLAARIGSDEFALVLPKTTGEDALRTAERIAERVAARTEGVSMSWGVGSWPIDGDSKGLVLLRADMQLQAARSIPKPARRPLDGASARQPHDATDGVRRILRLAREQLGMDVVYMAELSATSQVFRAIDGDAGSFGVAEDAELQLEATYCARMLDERISNAVPDTAAVPELAKTPITAEAGVGSYLGVPLKLTDGRLYGTLCAVSHSPTPELSERHVELMGFLAGLIAEQIEHDEQEATLRRSHAELSGIHALLAALIARDHYTGEHSKTVVCLASKIASRLELAEEQVAELEQVALLHDIGKVGIPDSVLQKRGPLNDREWQLMRQHPAIGARILAGTETLSHLAPAVKAEHERFDGGGYPEGLRGEEIPLASRIAFACDAYHAMTSNRPYRAALGSEKARAELLAGAGSQFDPNVVTALLAVLDGEEAAPGEPVATAVLASPLLRQTPVWEPQGPAGSPPALGKGRAVCRRCGTHAAVVIGHVAMSGICGNCGGYDLDLLEG